MNECRIRLFLVMEGESVEVLLDRRLSWKENLKILGELLDQELEEMEGMDPLRKIFLDKEIPLDRFHLPSFPTFFLF